MKSIVVASAATTRVSSCVAGSDREAGLRCSSRNVRVLPQLEREVAAPIGREELQIRLEERSCVDGDMFSPDNEPTDTGGKKTSRTWRPPDEVTTMCTRSVDLYAQSIPMALAMAISLTITRTTQGLSVPLPELTISIGIVKTYIYSCHL